MQAVTHTGARGADLAADVCKLARRAVGDLVLPYYRAGYFLLKESVRVQRGKQMVDTAFAELIIGCVALNKAREFVLKNALQMVYNDYDYIFIDCPPSLELLTLNALVAADNVIIPMQCEYYALEGIADLMTTIRMCNKRLNPSLRIQGIVMTMYDARTNLTQQVAFELKEYFGAKV